MFYRWETNWIGEEQIEIHRKTRNNEYFRKRKANRAMNKNGTSLELQSLVKIPQRSQWK